MSAVKAIIGFMAETVWLAFVVVGMVLLVLGSGAVQLSSFSFKPSGTQGPVLVAVGCVIFAVGVFLAWWSMRGVRALSATRYKVDFESPAASDGAAAEHVTIAGTLSRALPNGYELWLMRSWAANQAGDRPVGKVKFGADGLKWRIVNAYIGGSIGDLVTLQGWVVGPDGALLLATWNEGKSLYARLMNESGTEWTAATDFPGIRRIPGDTLASGSLELRRRAREE